MIAASPRCDLLCQSPATGRKGDPTEGREDHEDPMAKGAEGKKISRTEGTVVTEDVACGRVGVTQTKRPAPLLVEEWNSAFFHPSILPSFHTSSKAGRFAYADTPIRPHADTWSRLRRAPS
jgi:hypothetical protein